MVRVRHGGAYGTDFIITEALYPTSVSRIYAKIIAKTERTDAIFGVLEESPPQAAYLPVPTVKPARKAAADGTAGTGGRFLLLTTRRNFKQPSGVTVCGNWAGWRCMDESESSV